MLGELDRAKILITNYHAFKLRERLELSKGGRSLLQGRGEDKEEAKKNQEAAAFSRYENGKTKPPLALVSPQFRPSSTGSKTTSFTPHHV